MAKTVEEVMTPEPVCVSARATVTEAAHHMRAYNIGDVLIDDGNGGIHGVLTDRDIVIRAVATERDPAQTTVGEILSANPICVERTATVERAVTLMRQHALRRLPVCDGDRLVGVVSIGDLAIEQDSSSALADISAAPANH